MIETIIAFAGGLVMGFAAGWAACAIKRVIWHKPVEGIYWKDGMPNIAPGYFPPPPECKKPKKDDWDLEEPSCV